MELHYFVNGKYFEMKYYFLLIKLNIFGIFYSVQKKANFFISEIVDEMEFASFLHL